MLHLTGGRTITGVEFEFTILLEFGTTTATGIHITAIQLTTTVPATITECTDAITAVIAITVPTSSGTIVRDITTIEAALIGVITARLIEGHTSAIITAVR